jgi:hypothetical protein
MSNVPISSRATVNITFGFSAEDVTHMSEKVVAFLNAWVAFCRKANYCNRPLPSNWMAES